MITWWQHHTVTSAWRSLKAHVRVNEHSTDLADALADFLWEIKQHLFCKSRFSEVGHLASMFR
jgi:hypothetical protein